MCDTCPTHLLGPVEVGAKVARSKGARKVLFRGVALPMLPFALWGELHWWTVVIAAAAAAVMAATYGVTRILHKRWMVMPAATPAQRVAELERRRRNAIPIPAARPALPRGLSVTRGWQALPAPAKALPAAVVTGTVVPAPVRGKVER
jgi:hypothetical protein